MKQKILIIEDEAALLKVLEDKFLAEGFDVVKAEDGIAGLAAALGGAPDLILLDIIMPKKDGLSVLRELRADPRGKDVPVVILTNLSDAESINNGVANGVYDFLVKADWSLDDVVRKVRERLASRK
ncbi:MAG: response regulator [Candidatus Niyogibacteria bacterium]|nr:response regulator [Candidatus Niyogibacteria bacterium]